MNRPFYRLMGWRWGDDPDLQEEMMALQEPDTILAIRHMLSLADQLGESPFFRRDLVDVTKFYPAIRLNAYKKRLLEAAKRSWDKDSQTGKVGLAEFEQWAGKLQACMRAVAQLAGSLSHDRLRTEEERSQSWPRVWESEDNLRYIRERRTILLDLANWHNLIDYRGEDLQELIEFYYLPRVIARIESMRGGVASALEVDTGKGLKGVLMNFTPGPPHPADEKIVLILCSKVTRAMRCVSMKPQSLHWSDAS